MLQSANTTSALCNHLHRQHANAKLAQNPEFCVCMWNYSKWFMLHDNMFQVVLQSNTKVQVTSDLTKYFFHQVNKYSTE